MTPDLHGDDSPAKVCGRCRVDLDHGCFQDVIHVLKLSMNLLSIYQITHSGSGKKLEFTLDSVIIFDLSDGSKLLLVRLITIPGCTPSLTSLINLIMYLF
jgi:hypothetical protein